MKIIDLYENNIDESTVLELVRGDYSQAYARYKDGYHIYKGMDNESLGDITKLTPIRNRRSRWTRNYYTLWVNNHSDWSRFPKRSVVCSTNKGYARGYGKVFVILPRNGSLIGIAPTQDFWGSFDAITTPPNVNSATKIMLQNGLGLKEVPKTYEELLITFEKFDALDNDVKRSIVEEISTIEHYTQLIVDNGLESFYKEYYKPNGFTTTKVKDFNLLNNQEVWFDDDFLAIEAETAHYMMYSR